MGAADCRGKGSRDILECGPPRAYLADVEMLLEFSRAQAVTLAGDRGSRFRAGIVRCFIQTDL